MEGYGRVVAGSGMVLWKPCKGIKLSTSPSFVHHDHAAACTIIDAHSLQRPHQLSRVLLSQAHQSFLLI